MRNKKSNRIRTLMAGFAGAVFLGAVIANILPSTDANFNPSRLIDDGIMNNVGTMNASQIDAFLNARPHSCISPNSGFEAKIPTGYSPSGEFTYGSFGTAGQVIYAAAQAYDLNPQVLLVTLEKEQSLVSGRNSSSYCFGTEHKYAAATGYGCPDSGGSYRWTNTSLYRRHGVERTDTGGTCVNSASKAGFTQQVIRAAWLLKFGQQRSLGNIGWAIIRGSWNNSDDLHSCYSGPMTEGVHKTCPHGSATYYDGYRTINGQAIRMETGGTAALYWYTPHLHGNQLFVNIFTQWFGSPLAPSYHWEPINQTVYGDSSKTTPLGWHATLKESQTAYVVLKARNTGNVTWDKNGAHPVKLATWSPQDRKSSFCNQWASCDRPALPNESVVAPGETATFEFPIKAPAKPGTYKEHFTLVSEGKSWFNNPGMFIELKVVPPTYTWTEVWHSTYTDDTKTKSLGWDATVKEGQRFYVVVKAKNTGNVTWNKNGPNPVRLGTWNGQDRRSTFCDSASWITCNRAAAHNEPTVEPGATGTFEFWMQTPNRDGHFKEYFNLVAEGKTWMNPIGMFIGIQSTKLSHSWQPVNQTIFTDSTKTNPLGWNATLSANQSAYAVIRVKNTGNTTWTKDAHPNIRIATWFPQDRNSLFCNGWITCNRPATHNEPAVAPGEYATFEFPVRAPATPGTYNEYFNLVAEGKTWMNPAGMFVQFTVQ